jgi:hypothetical protein
MLPPSRPAPKAEQRWSGLARSTVRDSISWPRWTIARQPTPPPDSTLFLLGDGFIGGRFIGARMSSARPNWPPAGREVTGMNIREHGTTLASDREDVFKTARDHERSRDLRAGRESARGWGVTVHDA